VQIVVRTEFPRNFEGPDPFCSRRSSLQAPESVVDMQSVGGICSIFVSASAHPSVCFRSRGLQSRAPIRHIRVAGQEPRVTAVLSSRTPPPVFGRWGEESAFRQFHLFTRRGRAPAKPRHIHTGLQPLKPLLFAQLLREPSAPLRLWAIFFPSRHPLAAGKLAAHRIRCACPIYPTSLPPLSSIGLKVLRPRTCSYRNLPALATHSRPLNR
jgi:hypothetical protein